MGLLALQIANIRDAVPVVFWHCSAEYRGEPDDKYSNCLIEPGMDYCDLLKELHQAKDFRKYFLAIIPLILSVFVIALNFMFVVVVCSLIFHNRKGSRKRYAFLVSRSTSTIIAVILFYIVLIAWKLQSFNYFSATIFLFVGTMSFLSQAGTYLAMTSLLYAAVVHPLAYITRVTMCKCLTIIGLIWTISVGSSIAVGIFGGTLFYPQTAPIQCDFEDCQLPLAVCLVMLFATSYFTVIGSYIGMVMRMRWRCASKVSPTTTNASLPVQSFDSHTPAKIGNSKLPNWSNTAQDRNIKAMNRLAWNLATFTVSKSPLLAISIIALINLAELRTLGLGNKSHCKTFLKGKLFFQVELLASLAAIVWLIGMTVDPIINVLTDPAIYDFIKRSLRRMRYCVGKVSRKHIDVIKEKKHRLKMIPLNFDLLTAGICQ